LTAADDIRFGALLEVRITDIEIRSLIAKNAHAAVVEFTPIKGVIEHVKAVKRYAVPAMVKQAILIERLGGRCLDLVADTDAGLGEVAVGLVLVAHLGLEDLLRCVIESDGCLAAAIPGETYIPRVEHAVVRPEHAAADLPVPGEDRGAPVPEQRDAGEAALGALQRPGDAVGAGRKVNGDALGH